MTTLITGVGLLSIATGLLAMVTEPMLEAEGLFATLQIASGFSGVLVGFGLLAAAWGMRRDYWLGYAAGAVLLVLSTLHGVVQTRLVSIPLVVLSVAGIAMLVRQRRVFTQSVSLTPTQTGTLFAIGAFVAYGTVGTYVLRTDFDQVDTLIDALYYTLVTASTVGYGDIHPTTESGRLFAISLVTLGPATVAVAAGSLFAPLLKSRFERTHARIRQLNRTTSDNVVLLGDSSLDESVVEHLAEQVSLTVLTAEEDWARNLSDRGIDVRAGDPTDEETLEKLTLEDLTAVVIAVDAQTVPYAVLAVRRTDSDVSIVAVATTGDAADVAEFDPDMTIDPKASLARTTAAAALGRDADDD
ncbi:ion channel [Natronorubrum sp. DTA28]|uniref:ion channel n=1 Tax=Natronorubrum sp. DTA28 TaxID=3447019 RepID=UPI003F830703